MRREERVQSGGEGERGIKETPFPTHGERLLLVCVRDCAFFSLVYYERTMVVSGFQFAEISLYEVKPKHSVHGCPRCFGSVYISIYITINM